MNPEHPRRSPEEQAELDRADRRQFWIIAVIFVVAIGLLTGVYAAVSDTVNPPSPSTGAAQQLEEPAIEVPDGGAEPTNPGDRGGSQQIALLIGLMVAIAGGALWVVHVSRKARRRLAAQEAADAQAGTGPESGDSPADADLNASAGSPTPR